MHYMPHWNLDLLDSDVSHIQYVTRTENTQSLGCQNCMA
jgi:hypothetical protein